MPRAAPSPDERALPRGGFVWSSPPRYGQIRLVAPSSSLHPLTPGSRVGEIDACYCPATFGFVIPDCGLQGRLVTTSSDGQVAIRSLVIDSDDGAIEPSALSSLHEDFYEALLAAAIQVATIRARRTSDGQLSKIYKPTGGKGKGRITDRPWNAPEEIERTQALMDEAEEAFRNGKLKALNTKLKREAWVAKKTGLWSAGTVHLQLQLARNKTKTRE